MVAFVTSDLPANINTVEKLAVWAITVLSELHPTEKVFEIQGQAPEMVATAGVYDIALATDDLWTMSRSSRFVGRVSLPVSTAYKTGTKLWLCAENLSTLVIPSTFKTA